MKRVLVLLTAAILVISMVAGCGTGSSNKENQSSSSTQKASDSQTGSASADSDKKVNIEMITIDSEYIQITKDIWAIYEKDHPNVTINVTGDETGEHAALDARIAAGNPPHIRETDPESPVTKDKYDYLVNLLEIDYPYFDKYTYDVKTRWSEVSGVKDYVPIISPFLPVERTLVFHRDEMDSLGLNPKESVKTMDDLKKFLLDLKGAVDKSNGKYQYVLDTAWLPNEIYCWLNAFTLGFSSYDEMCDVWSGKIAWDDMEKNPYVETFEYFKEMYKQGILPENWWQRQWEQEFEPAFITKKSILTFHGPWIWSKAYAQNPDIKLDGFYFPANKEGVTFHECIAGDYGVGLFKAYQNTPEFKEIVDAFTWFTSPEITKKRCEAMGRVPAMDLSNLGELKIKAPQYLNVMKPLLDGTFGNVKADMRPWGNVLVTKYKVAGTAEVLNDDSIAAMWGDYMQDKLSLEEFMKNIQSRWLTAYKFPQ
jgi:ABC-type glycerol-3-phosphate transport system substrate-binding protein